MPTSPTSYLRHFWFQLLIAAALACKGWATTDVVFAVLPAAPLWPWGLWITAAIVLASTTAPFHSRVQAATGGTLMGLAFFRILTYLGAIAFGDLGPRANALAWYLISLWLFVFAIGARWPKLSVVTGTSEAADQRP